MAMSLRSRILLLTYVVISIADLVAEGLHLRTAAFVGGVLAMPALIAFLGSVRPLWSRLVRLVMVALTFSWLGDWLGGLIPPTVLTKIAFFFVGHVFFVMAFLPFRRRSVLRRPVLLAVYMLVVAALLVVIVPSAGPLSIPVVLYGTLLTAMAVLAGGVSRLAGTGAAIFVVSDLAIAVSTFVLHGTLVQAELVIMSTYLLAQVLIVLGVVQRDGRELVGRV
jgi:uncharacterized membrane protein YhhN